MRKNRALPWVALFFVLNCINVQIGGTNAASRLAQLRAITELHVIEIDRYAGWTEDWARAPNGHLYPNKAPGGTLLGLPAFFVVDGIWNAVSFWPMRPGQLRAPPREGELTIFNMLMQFLPFALLVLFAAGEFAPELGRAGTHFFALAALFGNTASIYMNTYFGHGLAATLLFAGFLSWLKRRYALSGGLLAACLLTEYGTGFVLPFFLAATLARERSARPILRIAVGSIPFAALWIWYHQTAFGSAFAVAIKFSNPEMITSPDESGGGLWGMFALPTPFRLQKLLFGPERGLLFTQPWVLAAFPLMFRRTSLPRGTKLFLCGGLCGLLWMNASVGGWHGGWALGPRYLSLVLPALALAIGLSWRELSRPWHLLLWIGLAVSLVFRVMIFPFSVLAAPVNLWWLHGMMYGNLSWYSRPYSYLYLELALIAATSAWVAYREKT